jgi:hypothetical protein
MDGAMISSSTRMAERAKSMVVAGSISVSLLCAVRVMLVKNQMGMFMID